jgi:hypothetical protein
MYEVLPKSSGNLTIAREPVVVRPSAAAVCRELKYHAKDDPNFISKVITGDESWVYDERASF